MPDHQIRGTSKYAKLFSYCSQVNEEEVEERKYVCGYIRWKWCPTWCVMLRHNVVACGRDTREGVRSPRLTARTGPCPHLNPSSDTVDNIPRQLRENRIGEVNSSITEFSERLKVVGSGARSWGGIPSPMKSREASQIRHLTATATFQSMNTIDAASSRRELVKGGTNGNIFSPSTVLPAECLTVLTQREHGYSEGNLLKDISTPSGVRSLERGASGRGLIGDDGTSYIDNSHKAPILHQYLFAAKHSGSTEDDSPRHRSSELILSRDLISVKGGCIAKNPKENELYINRPFFEERAAGRKKPSFGLFKSRAPVESDVPRRNSVLNTMRLDSAMDRTNCDSNCVDRGLGNINKDVEEAKSGRGKIGLASRVPWGSQYPAEIDLRFRRSMDVYMCFEAGAGSDGSESNVGGLKCLHHDVSRVLRGANDMTVNGSERKNLGGKGHERDLPRTPWASRNPTVIDLPRRRFVDTPVCLEEAAALDHSEAQSVVPNNPDGKRKKIINPQVPSSFRRPTEIDLPLRRSVDVSAYLEAADTSDQLKINSGVPENSDSEVSRGQRKVSRITAGVNQSESNKGRKQDLPQTPGLLRNPTVVDLPRRRSIKVPVYLGEAAAGKNSETQSVVSNDHDGTEKGRRDPQVPWGFRRPTAIDLPRRRSVDVSVCFEVVDTSDDPEINSESTEDLNGTVNRGQR